MSADNYMLIRQVGDRFAVTMEFASDARPGSVDHMAAWFDRPIDAMVYAIEQPTEYGVRLDASVKLPKPVPSEPPARPASSGA